MIILEPAPIAALTFGDVSAGGEGSGLANLLTPDPKEVWAASAPAVTRFVLDFGAARQVDSVFLGFTNAPADVGWQIEVGNDLAAMVVTLAGTSLRAADAIGPRYHGFARFAVVAARYVRITVNSPSAPCQAGILMAGLAFQSPYEFGSGRQAIDTGFKQDLIGGGFGIEEGVVKAQLRWTFPDLTPVQRRKLWALISRRGETRPIVVVEELSEDGGAGEEIHYGLFDKLQAYEREAPGATRWALSMTEWV